MNVPTKITAAPPLFPFVRWHSRRQFDTQGKAIIELGYACDKMYLTMHEAGSVAMQQCISGMLVQEKGTNVFDGECLWFSIHSKPSGFYKNCGLSPKAFPNQTIAVTSVLEMPLQHCCTGGTSHYRFLRPSRKFGYNLIS